MARLLTVVAALLWGVAFFGVIDLLVVPLLTVVAALLWGVAFFGVIDLLVVPLQDERFHEHYLLETGWGLLITMLVVVPLGLWAVRPGWRVLPWQVVAVAAAILVTGAIVPAPGQVVVAALLLLSVAPAVWAARSASPRRGTSLGGADLRLVGLVAVCGVASVVYAAEMIAAARSGIPDDETWGLMHLPMQAALGVALTASAATAVLAGGAGAPGWRIATLPPAASAVWIGVVSVAYPDLVGSVGRAGAAAAIAWGITFAVVAVLDRSGRGGAAGRQDQPVNGTSASTGSST